MYTLGRGKVFGSYEPRVDLRVDLKLKTWRWRKTAEGGSQFLLMSTWNSLYNAG